MLEDMKIEATYVCAFLDIEGAFDNMTHDAVRGALNESQADRTASKWKVKIPSTN